MPLDARRLGDVSHYATYDSVLARLERDTIRSVNEQMHGQDVGRVLAVLVARLEGRFPGMDLDDLNLEKVALSISRDTFAI